MVMVVVVAAISCLDIVTDDLIYSGGGGGVFMCVCVLVMGRNWVNCGSVVWWLW